MTVQTLLEIFFVNVLGIRKQIEVNRAHPLGNSNNTMIAHLPNNDHINTIFQNVRKLKGTKFFVYRDYSLEIRKKWSKLLAIKKEIIKLAGEVQVFMGYNYFSVLNVKFTWSNMKLMAGAEDGVLKLRELLGVNLSEAVERITNNAGVLSEDSGRPEPGRREEDHQGVF